MAVYTLINKSQLQAFIAYYDLGELIDFKPIQAGTTNSNYEFTAEKTNKQSKYILTIVEQDLSRQNLEFCVQYAQALQDQDIPAAAAIKDRHGKSYRKFINKMALITPFIKGESLLPGSKQISEQVYGQFGEVLAKMHLVGLKFKHQRQNPAGLKWCLNTYDSLSDKLPSNEIIIIKDEIDFLLKNKELLDNIKLGIGAVHADLFCDNILLYNNKLQGIIDFYYSCTDYFLYDLAIVVNDWVIGTNGQFNNENYNSLINGYLSGLKNNKKLYNELLDNINKDIWQYMLRKSALRFWLLRLSARMAPQESNIKTIKDPTEYEIKLMLHRDKKRDFFITKKG